MDLPQSDGCFVKAYPAETTEAFCDGRNAAFSFFAGVPQSIVYDNTKIAVARILGDGRRKRTRAFSQLQSHYLFEDRFGRSCQRERQGEGRRARRLHSPQLLRAHSLLTRASMTSTPASRSNAALDVVIDYAGTQRRLENAWSEISRLC